MSLISDIDSLLISEDSQSTAALADTLSLTDTLEEDRERYQDVICDLVEFEAEEAGRD